jgi:hypothetical protein
MDTCLHDNGEICNLPLREHQLKVIEYIENTFNQIIQSIQDRPCGHPSIVLKRITDVKPRGPDDGWEVVDREMRISFPGKSKEEAWRFSQLWIICTRRVLTFLVACAGKILSEIHSAINGGEVVTKRYIHPRYSNTRLFLIRAETSTIEIRTCSGARALLTAMWI